MLSESCFDCNFYQITQVFIKKRLDFGFLKASEFDQQIATQNKSPFNKQLIMGYVIRFIYSKIIQVRPRPRPGPRFRQKIRPGPYFGPQLQSLSDRKHGLGRTLGSNFNCTLNIAAQLFRGRYSVLFIIFTLERKNV